MVPEGDNRERNVCTDCGFIHYLNPRIVVGAVVQYDEQVLLCRRAIPPRTGFWTLPAGYLETGETERPLGIYSLPRISLIQLIFAAQLMDPDIAPGAESLEVRLFSWSEVPWDDLAFPSVRWALEDWKHGRTTGTAAAAFGPFDRVDLTQG